MMVAAVISGPCASGMRSLSTISASWRSTDWRLRLAKAVTRMSAPSSSRMLVEIRLAMYSSASGGALSPSWTAFLRRIAMRVSSSRLDVGEQAPFEPAAQPVFEGHQALGRAVAGDDDLLARVVQRVEGVEELFLRSFLVLQELDVVDQQHVHVAVTAPEPVLLAVPDHVDEVVGELFRADIPHLDALVEALRVVPDGVQQVGLAQAGVAVDEQRVIRLRGRLGDRHRGGVREAVARADDERLEGVLGVEPGLGGRRPGQARPVAGAVVQPAGVGAEMPAGVGAQVPGGLAAERGGRDAAGRGRGAGLP